MIKKIIPGTILQFLCVPFEIFEFEVSAITIMEIRQPYMEYYEKFDLKYWILNMEIPWNLQSCCNLPRSFDFEYKTHRLPIWVLPDYVPLISLVVYKLAKLSKDMGLQISC